MQGLIRRAWLATKDGSSRLKAFVVDLLVVDRDIKGGKMAKFPSPEWTQALMDKLNSDSQYAEIARNWEGDLAFEIDPGGSITERIVIYLDLWHGTCRQATYGADLTGTRPAFVLKAPYGNFLRVLQGELHPMQAMLTRKLSVQGNMALMMRNVPTVLDFVRCAQEVTDGIVE